MVIFILTNIITFDIIMVTFQKESQNGISLPTLSQSPKAKPHKTSPNK